MNTFNKKLILPLGTAAFFFLGACSSHQATKQATKKVVDAPKPAPVKAETVYTYGDDAARLSSRAITFARGSAMLNGAAQKDLRDLVATAKARGDIQDIKVSVWSDRDFPSGNNEELSKADRDLANRRSNSIENFLEDVLDTPSVEIFSMAERANWFARMLNTDNAELKTGLARRSYRLSDAQFDLLRDGQPSHAVIVIESGE